jgi:spoIIIJ-associated protein
MPALDNVAAANRINDLLKVILSHGGFRLKYRITVNQPSQSASGEENLWKSPDILVDMAGPDSGLLLERGAELLNSLEHLALKALRLESDDHDKVSFDCRNSKAVRRQELKLAADVAAEKVRKTSVPYEFAPMNARERRMLHLALGSTEDLRTESQGEGGRRYVVVYPKNYSAPSRSRR